MLKSKKQKVISFLTVLSLPVMLSFQNCGQQGTLAVSNANLASNSSSNMDPSQNSDGGLVLTTPGAETPISENPPNGSDDEVVHTQDCRNIVIADVKLNVDSVSAGSVCTGHGNRQSAEFELVSDSVITLDHRNLKLRALKSGEVKEVFVKLSDSGNQILSMDDVALDLVAPSTKESGLKIQLKKVAQVIAGLEYDLKLDIRAEDQFVTNSNKCVLKPVIKSATLSHSAGLTVSQ